MPTIRNLRDIDSPAQQRQRAEFHLADDGKRAAIPMIHPKMGCVSQASNPTETQVPIRRRTLLVSLLAGATACAVPRLAGAAMAMVLPREAVNRRFSVFYRDDKIGAHTISFSAVAGQTRITTEIDLIVKALFFTVRAFRHRSVEIWRDGRLMSLTSETVEHGETLHVAGAATPKGFRVVSTAGPFIAAPSAMTSNSLWTPAVLEQKTVIDAQHGGVIGIGVRRLADEQIALAGGQIRTTRYRFITPYLAGSIWYDDSSRWVRGEFEYDGAQIQYRLDV